jgi:hypothetical protein
MTKVLFDFIYSQYKTELLLRVIILDSDEITIKAMRATKSNHTIRPPSSPSSDGTSSGTRVPYKTLSPPLSSNGSTLRDQSVALGLVLREVPTLDDLISGRRQTMARQAIDRSQPVTAPNDHTSKMKHSVLAGSAGPVAERQAVAVAVAVATPTAGTLLKSHRGAATDPTRKESSDRLSLQKAVVRLYAQDMLQMLMILPSLGVKNYYSRRSSSQQSTWFSTSTK